MKLTTENLLTLNRSIHQNDNDFDYRMAHILLARDYSLVINEKLSNAYSKEKLEINALAHDVLKENSFSKKQTLDIEGYHVPCDLNRYVRTHLDILAKYGLDEYFNSDIQLHALSAGILLDEVFETEDPEILYPVLFHSCPAMNVYQDQTETVRGMVDVMMLADKLSSNYLRINMTNTKVRLDLDLIVFGEDGSEFNYSLGLFLARLISQGHSKGTLSREATEYYYQRLKRMNPLIIRRPSLHKLGEAKLFPERQSKVVTLPKEAVNIGQERGQSN